uniref:Uncharacterized protein n=1 Tax=Candidatus Kentrum sp. LFY TaxID=2126342 RepID=A0A450V6U9_9GAMM|nr:MAG: hypothetical protein BECKLFY1418A_GA0070994_11169 [Candidatus Kentron sp. LFY]
MGLDTGTGFSEFLFFRYVNMLALRASDREGGGPWLAIRIVEDLFPILEYSRPIKNADTIGRRSGQGMKALVGCA